MRFHRIMVGCTGGLLLATCASCNLQEFDTNGDGYVTRSELLQGLLDSACGDQSDDGSTDDGTTDDGTGGDASGDETPTDETPTEETPVDETDATQSSRSTR